MAIGQVTRRIKSREAKFNFWRYTFYQSPAKSWDITVDDHIQVFGTEVLSILSVKVWNQTSTLLVILMYKRAKKAQNAYYNAYIKMPIYNSKRISCFEITFTESLSAWRYETFKLF